MHWLLPDFITNFILTAENIDDRNTIFDLISEKNSIKIIGNKGYINNQLKSALAKKKSIDNFIET